MSVYSDAELEERRLRAVKRDEVFQDRVDEFVKLIGEMVRYGAPPPVLLAKLLLSELQLRLGRADP